VTAIVSTHRERNDCRQVAIIEFAGIFCRILAKPISVAPANEASGRTASPSIHRTFEILPVAACPRARYRRLLRKRKTPSQANLVRPIPQSYFLQKKKKTSSPLSRVQSGVSGKFFNETPASTAEARYFRIRYKTGGDSRCPVIDEGLEGH